MKIDAQAVAGIGEESCLEKLSFPVDRSLPVDLARYYCQIGDTMDDQD